MAAVKLCLCVHVCNFFSHTEAQRHGLIPQYFYLVEK